MILTTKTMDSLLGRSDERYFGDVFRGFFIRILSMEQQADRLTGQLKVDYIGPRRPHGEAPHLGSIEFTALAMRLASHTLNRLGRINIADTNRAFLRHYEFSGKEILYTGTHSFCCRLLSSEMDLQSTQGSTSVFEIAIDSSRTLVTIDHRGGSRYLKLPEKETLSVALEQLYSAGYKYTALDIGPVKTDVHAQQISAPITYSYLLGANSLHGIGSARDALLATDAIRVFGQLMQVLLYELENSDRHNCANIWLRRMELRSERPLFTGEAEASVRFENIRKISKGDNNWKLIALSGTVGNFFGKFEVAFEVKK